MPRRTGAGLDSFGIVFGLLEMDDEYMDARMACPDRAGREEEEKGKEAETTGHQLEEEEEEEEEVRSLVLLLLLQSACVHG